MRLLPTLRSAVRRVLAGHRITAASPAAESAARPTDASFTLSREVRAGIAAAQREHAQYALVVIDEACRLRDQAIDLIAEMYLADIDLGHELSARCARLVNQRDWQRALRGRAHDPSMGSTQ